MDKQFLDKDGLQIVANNVIEAKEVAAGAMALAQEAIDGLVPSSIVSKGTVSFTSLPSLNSVEVGWMYNISDAFTTTSDFVISDVFERAGSNVYCINAGSGVKKWDVFTAGNKTFELLTPPNSDYDTNGYLQNLEDPEGNLTGTISDWYKAKGVIITVDNGYNEKADNTYPHTMMSVTYDVTAPNTSANNTTDKKQTFIAMKSPTSESLSVCITGGTYGDRVVSRYFTMSIDTEGEYTITCPYSPKEDGDSESDLNWYVTKIRSIYIMY